MNELKKWSILNVLHPKFMEKIRIALVFGSFGDNAIIVTNNDEVYAFGRNLDGCLGIGLDVVTFSPIEVKSLCGMGVRKFAIGSGILALTESKEVYCYDQTDYTPIPDLSGIEIKDIVCGGHYFLALTDEREIFIWGEIENAAKELTKIPPTKLITQFKGDNIVSITSEMNSILALTRKGFVYQWNHPSTESILDTTPQRIEDLAKIVKVVSGYDHTLALSKEGSLYIWGSNKHGQFGNGNTVGDVKPYKVKSQMVGYIVDIAAGENISAAVNEIGRVYMWGLCFGQNILIPTLMPVSNVDDVILFCSSCEGMRESRKFRYKRETNLLECIQQNFDDSSNSDLVIRVKYSPIHVHKAILRLRSAYFKSMFNKNSKEKNKSIIEIDEYSYSVYKTFLYYLYTGNVVTSPDQVFALMKLADQYLDTELAGLCNQMTLNNHKQQSTSNVDELKKWPILNLLDSEFLAQVRTAYVTGRYGNEAFIITDDDKVYGLGVNKFGCLGIGVRNNTLHATEVEVLSGKGVTKLAIGGGDGSHVLALTKTGKVYSWGCNSFGQLGVGSKDNQWTPIQITHELSGKKVIDIACSGLRSLAVTYGGKVYQWGYESSDSCMLLPTPYKFQHYFNSESIVLVACMASLNVGVTESGKIYCWDYNTGIQEEEMRDFFQTRGSVADNERYSEYIKSIRFKAPESIVGLEESNIVKIVAGSNHILALSEDGSLHLWGSNVYGELGCGDTRDTNESWISYKMPKWTMGPIADIAAGPHMSAAVNQEGDVFMWGQCLSQIILIPLRTRFYKITDVLLNFCTTRGIHQLLKLPQTKDTSVLGSIEQGYNDSTTSDLVIMVQDKPIHVHKFILLLRSSYCERMLQGDWARKNPVIIRDQHSYEVYASFFKYLYTDRVDDVSSTNLCGLMDLANQLSDSRLINYCADRIDKIK